MYIGEVVGVDNAKILMMTEKNEEELFYRINLNDQINTGSVEVKKGERIEIKANEYNRMLIKKL